MKYFFVTVTMMFVMAMFSAPMVLAENLNNALSNLVGVADKAGFDESDADVANIVGTVINAALTLVGLIFLVLMVYAGYMWMTAHGEEEQIGKARKIITSAVIGIVIVVSAYAITFFVTSRFE